MNYQQGLPRKPKIQNQSQEKKDFIVLNIYNTPEKNLKNANLDMTKINQTNDNLNVENNDTNLMTDDSLKEKIRNENLREPYPLSEFRSNNKSPPPLPFKNKFSKSLNPFYYNQNYNSNNIPNQIERIDHKPIYVENTNKIVPVVENNNIYVVVSDKKNEGKFRKRHCVCIILFLINPLIGLIYYFLFCR